MDASRIIQSLQTKTLRRRFSKLHLQNLEAMLGNGCAKHTKMGLGRIVTVNPDRMTISIEFQGGKTRCLDLAIATQILAPVDPPMKD
jgi:hypothetical protein